MRQIFIIFLLFLMSFYSFASLHKCNLAPYSELKIDNSGEWENLKEEILEFIQDNKRQWKLNKMPFFMNKEKVKEVLKRPKIKPDQIIWLIAERYFCRYIKQHLNDENNIEWLRKYFENRDHYIGRRAHLISNSCEFDNEVEQTRISLFQKVKNFDDSWKTSTKPQDLFRFDIKNTTFDGLIESELRENQGEILSFAFNIEGIDDEKTLIINDFFITSSYRNKGIAKWFLTYFLLNIENQLTDKQKQEHGILKLEDIKKIRFDYSAFRSTEFIYEISSSSKILTYIGRDDIGEFFVPGEALTKINGVSLEKLVEMSKKLVLSINPENSLEESLNLLEESIELIALASGAENLNIYFPVIDNSGMAIKKDDEFIWDCWQHIHTAKSRVDSSALKGAKRLFLNQFLKGDLNSLNIPKISNMQGGMLTIFDREKFTEIYKKEIKEDIPILEQDKKVTEFYNTIRYAYAKDEKLPLFFISILGELNPVQSEIFKTFLKHVEAAAVRIYQINRINKMMEEFENKIIENVILKNFLQTSKNVPQEIFDLITKYSNKIENLKYLELKVLREFINNEVNIPKILDAMPENKPLINIYLEFLHASNIQDLKKKAFKHVKTLKAQRVKEEGGNLNEALKIISDYLNIIKYESLFDSVNQLKQEFIDIKKQLNKYGIDFAKFKLNYKISNTSNIVKSLEENNLIIKDPFENDFNIWTDPNILKILILNTIEEIAPDLKVFLSVKKNTKYQCVSFSFSLFDRTKHFKQLNETQYNLIKASIEKIGGAFVLNENECKIYIPLNKISKISRLKSFDVNHEIAKAKDFNLENNSINEMSDIAKLFIIEDLVNPRKFDIPKLFLEKDKDIIIKTLDELKIIYGNFLEIEKLFENVRNLMNQKDLPVVYLNDSFNLIKNRLDLSNMIRTYSSLMNKLSSKKVKHYFEERIITLNTLKSIFESNNKPNKKILSLIEKTKKKKEKIKKAMFKKAEKNKSKEKDEKEEISRENFALRVLLHKAQNDISSMTGFIFRLIARYEEMKLPKGIAENFSKIMNNFLKCLLINTKIEQYLLLRNHSPIQIFKKIKVLYPQFKENFFKIEEFFSKYI